MSQVVKLKGWPRRVREPVWLDIAPGYTGRFARIDRMQQWALMAKPWKERPWKPGDSLEVLR